MTLQATRTLLSDELARDHYDTYAVRVHAGGETVSLFSDNANEDTYFDIASMGKILVTSNLILRAVGEGLLSLQDPLDRFFADVPAEKKALTIQQLLTHTSGIIRIPIPVEIADAGREAVAAHILSAPLAYEPGTRWIYSCNGYILLGYIAEKIYGERLDELYEHKLKNALGYTRSRFNIALDEPNAAVCYKRPTVGTCRVDDENVYNMRGVAGSGASFWTLHDISLFAEAVLRKDPKLYAPELFDLAEKDYTPDFDTGRGLGYLMVDGRYPQTGKLFRPGSFGHCGHTGTSIFMQRDPELYVIILTNATRFANKKNDFRHYDYNEVCEMRARIHNAVLDDLTRQGIL